MTKGEMRKWIDEASYEDLLRKWRFAPAGDPFFTRENDPEDYYGSVMNKKKAEIGDEAAVRISKIVGWEG